MKKWMKWTLVIVLVMSAVGLIATEPERAEQRQVLRNTRAAVQERERAQRALEEEERLALEAIRNDSLEAMRRTSRISWETVAALFPEVDSASVARLMLSQLRLADSEWDLEWMRRRAAEKDSIADFCLVTESRLQQIEWELIDAAEDIGHAIDSGDGYYDAQRVRLALWQEREDLTTAEQRLCP